MTGELPSVSRLRSVTGTRDNMMSIGEAVPARRAKALHALAANLVRGHLVVPTCLIAAKAGILNARMRCMNMQDGRPHVEPTKGLPGCRLAKAPFDNRAPTSTLLGSGEGGGEPVEG